MSFELGDLSYALPILVLVVGGLLLLLMEAFSTGRSRAYLVPMTVLVVLASIAADVSVWSQVGEGGHSIMSGMLEIDRLSLFANAIFLTACGLTALLAGAYMQEHRFEFGEFYALIVFATAGMMILAAASDMVSIFLGLEIMSLAVYVLTGSWRRSPKSSEGAMKYFLVGSVASAVLLYGMALIYGAVGSTSLQAIANSKGAYVEPIFIIGLLLVLTAFAFKIAAVPFHMWAPDAYEGAPTPVTGFMAAGVKAAAFVILIRMCGTAFSRSELALGSTGWVSILKWVAVITMTFGNLAALRQENIKRLLAYSSVSHAGYLLIGLIATATVGNEARGPLLYYLAAYTFTTMGAFGVVAWLGRHGDERLQLDDWAGLAAKHPAAALAMTIFMLSLGGVPPTAGFFGKFYLFRAALGRADLTWLVVIAVLNSVVSVYYYLRVVTTMYFREPARESSPLQSRSVTAALVLAVIGTLLIGILPGWLVETASSALLGS